jgi:Zn-dependent peptidase ImmA (M78 family)
MSERALRRQCRSLLRELDIRPPLDVRELCRRLAERRGRPIRLVAYPIKVPGPFGLWFMTPTTDVIFYQQETAPPHQDHIILHEIGHIIADHPSDESDERAWDALAPGRPPESTTRALRRTCYDSAYEREAELVATIILEWASVLNPLYRSLRAREDPGVDRIGTSLANRRGWM